MRTIILVAGPSGSGKSRLAHETGCPHVGLDEFYRDGDEPGLPHTLGIVDWDDVASWNLAGAVAALVAAATDQAIEVPIYSIAGNARTGTRRLDLSGVQAVVSEGIFAVDALRPLRDRGVQVVPIWLDRPRTLVAALRFARDVREKRKRLPVLVSRGAALWRTEPQMRRRAIAAGFEPLTMRAALRLVRQRA
ncbi:uridine kinase [Mariniluteicoccus flavus]